MSYAPSDFKDMMFPFHEIKGDVLESCPKLKQFPEFSVNIPEKDKIIKYIGFAYDKGSPLFQYADDVVKRKVEAAKLAEFEIKDRKFSDYVEKVMKCEVLEVNLMIIRYCRLMRSRKYLSFIASNEVLEEAFRELMSYASNKKNKISESDEKITLVNKIKTLSEATDELQKEILTDDAKGLNEVMFVVSENDDINLTPEDFSLVPWNHPIIHATGEITKIEG